eukprot:gene15528-17752_t
MVSRFLLQYPDFTAFPFSSFPVLYTDAKSSILSLVRNKLNLSLSVAASEESVGGANEFLHHCVMFSAFDCLMKQGFQSFATDDQLRGVVARFVDNNMMEVCSLRNCVINDSGHGQINVEVAQYKCSPLRIEEIPLRQPITSQDASEPVWRAVEFPTQCVFLPTNEEVQLLAVATYEEARAAGTVIITSSSNNSAHHKTNSKNKTVCTPPSKNTPNTDTATHRAAYENALFLTSLDRLNRARGFGAYLPDTYSKARLYWELGFGINLPAEPDSVGFARILTSLGEVIVPQQALARGVAEVPWRNPVDPQRCAAYIYSCLQHGLPSPVRALHPPQHPEELAQQLRNMYMGYLDHSGENGTVDNSRDESNRGDSNGGDRRPNQVPTKTLFVSALRMKEVAQKTGTSAVAPVAARVKPSTEKTAPPTTAVKVNHSRGGDSDGGEDDFFNDEDSLFGPATTPAAPAVSTPRAPPARAGLTKTTVTLAESTIAKKIAPVLEKSLPAKRPIAATELGQQTSRSQQQSGKKPDGDEIDSDSSDISLSDSSDSSPLLTQDSLPPVSATPLLPLKAHLPSRTPAGAHSSLASTATAASKSTRGLKTKPAHAPAPAVVTAARVKRAAKPKTSRASRK